MQRDAWRTYLELALGLTEASRKKAKKAIKSLVNQSGASVDQVRSLTEELVETSLANREAIAKLVRGELDRALGLVGLASSEEVAELNDRIADLEGRLRAAEAGTTDGTTDGENGGKTGTAEPAGDVLSAGRAAVKKAAARKATTTAATSPAKVAAKKAAATRTAAGTAKAATAKKATARKATAKKATAKKAVAKKAPAKQAPAEATPDTPEAGNTR